MKGNHEQIVELAKRCIAAFDTPFSIRGMTIRIGVSIGLAASTTSSVNADKLVQKADRALYRAKAKGRNTWTSHLGDTHRRRPKIPASFDLLELFAVVATNCFRCKLTHLPRRANHYPLAAAEPATQRDLSCPNNSINVGDRHGRCVFPERVNRPIWYLNRSD